MVLLDEEHGQEAGRPHVIPTHSDSTDLDGPSADGTGPERDRFPVLFHIQDGCIGMVDGAVAILLDELDIHTHAAGDGQGVGNLGIIRCQAKKTADDGVIGTVPLVGLGKGLIVMNHGLVGYAARKDMTDSPDGDGPRRMGTGGPDHHRADDVEHTAVLTHR